MHQGGRVRALQESEQQELNNSATIATPSMGGLAGWVLSLLQSCRGQRVTHRKQLRLVETLPLGGKRQLMLVTCAGESFLIGGGVESVETIVRVKAEASLDPETKSLEGRCP